MEIIFLAVLFISFLLLTMVYSVIVQMIKKPSPKKETKQTPKQTKDKPSQDDLERVLKHMYTSGTIDTQTYNQMLIKNLPYF